MAHRCLYYITDRSQFPGDDNARRDALLAKIEEAARAGVDYIQLREKDLSAKELEKLAREVLSIMRETVNRNIVGRNASREIASGSDVHAFRTRLLVNSRTDLALAAGAEGVHLRSDDLSPLDVRNLWRSCGAGTRDREVAPIIAASCHTANAVIRAASAGATFAVFGPVFGKQGAGTTPTGLDGLRDACRAKIPVLALGAVSKENAAACLDAGAAGVAGIRLFQQEKIEELVHILRAV